MRLITRRIDLDPSVFCDICEEPCKSHFVKQCPECGRYICRTCWNDHAFCEVQPRQVVRQMMPKFVNLIPSWKA